MRPSQSKSPVELRVITQAHWAFDSDAGWRSCLPRLPNAPYYQQAQAPADRRVRRDRYPQQGTSCLGWDAFRGKDGTQGRQAARGMTARPPGASLLGGVRPLECVRWSTPALGSRPGVGVTPGEGCVLHVYGLGALGARRLGVSRLVGGGWLGHWLVGD